jgi:hypothetical protein
MIKQVYVMDCLSDPSVFINHFKVITCHAYRCYRELCATLIVLQCGNEFSTIELEDLPAQYL